MTELAARTAVRIGLTEADVDKVFDAHEVRGHQVLAVPSQLLVTSLRFRGTKRLTGNRPDGTLADGERHTVPFDFEWQVGPGVWGVGTEQNLRGKTSILKTIEWALRGRCGVSKDLKKWVEHVELEFTVDGAPHRVQFDNDEGRPDGTLQRLGPAARALAQFSTEVEFERVMDDFMMRSLNLPVISSAQNDERADHNWPTYAGALFIHGETLGSLVGEHAIAGLPSRLLAMFAGSPWAPARADVVAALKIATRRHTDASAARQDAANRRAAELTGELAAARADLDRAIAGTTAVAGGATFLGEVHSRAEEIAALDAQVAALGEQFLSTREVVRALTAEVVAAESEQLAVQEDALARRFFHALTPTQCPRCSHPVTEEQRAREATEHHCSLCDSELELDTVVTAGEVAAAEDVEVDQSLPAEDALRAALVRAQTDHDGVAHELARVRGEREQLSSQLRGEAMLRRAQESLRAERERSRAEGVVAALERQVAQAQIPPAEDEARARDIVVLKAASAVVTALDQEVQKEVLDVLSQDITDLARSFGMGNLERVELRGNSHMKVHKGGATANYGDCERGEMLRLKLATAIALIRLASSSAAGRHPGLLLLDSPKAEEIDDRTFATMMGALKTAVEASATQVVVATRDPVALRDALGADRCRLAWGMNYAW